MMMSKLLAQGADPAVHGEHCAGSTWITDGKENGVEHCGGSPRGPGGEGEPGFVQDGEQSMEAGGRGPLCSRELCGREPGSLGTGFVSLLVWT